MVNTRPGTLAAAIEANSTDEQGAMYKLFNWQVLLQFHVVGESTVLGLTKRMEGGNYVKNILLLGTPTV